MQNNIVVGNGCWWKKKRKMEIWGRKRKEGGNEEGKIALSADFSAQLISFERQRRVFHQ